jgi:hypothetical protein
MTIRTYSTAEVAEQIGCSERWLTEQVRADRFPEKRVARHWRMTDQDVRYALAICANGGHSVHSEPVASLSGLTRTSRNRVSGQ